MFLIGWINTIQSTCTNMNKYLSKRETRALGVQPVIQLWCRIWGCSIEKELGDCTVHLSVLCCRDKNRLGPLTDGWSEGHEMLYYALKCLIIKSDASSMLYILYSTDSVKACECFPTFTLNQMVAQFDLQCYVCVSSRGFGLHHHELV